MTELTEINNNDNSFMDIIERVISNPDADVEKLEKLFELQERQMQKQAVIDFNQAMARLQPKLPVVLKKSKAHNSKYAKYEDLDAQIRQLYTGEGFSVAYTTKRDDQGNTTYYGTLSHVCGHSITSEITLPDDTSGSKNAIQAKGSTTTYAKRYLLIMLFNVVTCGEDDDGNMMRTKIDASQVEVINGLLSSTKTDLDKFLSYMGVEKVEDISGPSYSKAASLLKKKAKDNENS